MRVPGLRAPVRAGAIDANRGGYALFAGCAAVVFLASVVDPPSAAAGSVPRPLGVAPDKWVHAGAYAGLVGLLCRATGARATRAVLLAAVAVSGYGLAVEFVQGALPARSFELADAAANAVGAGLAALAWRVRLAVGPR